MTSVELHPVGAVDPHVISSNTQYTLPPVVGAPPQWSDNDDSTYAQVVNDVRGKESPQAYLPATTLDFTPTGYIWHVRAACPAGTAHPLSVVLEVTDWQEGGQIQIEPPATPGWISGTEAITYPDLVTPDLSAGNAMLMVDQSDTIYSGTLDVYIYEVWIEFIAGAPQPYLMPRRLHPREDAQGIGGARLWPPPRSRRSFGGYL